jgi:hypothetical protein
VGCWVRVSICVKCMCNIRITEVLCAYHSPKVALQKSATSKKQGQQSVLSSILFQYYCFWLIKGFLGVYLY